MIIHKMNRFINILAAGGTGGTFLDWSISYLSSLCLEKVYIDNSMQAHTVNVLHNPLKNHTCHLHSKTHPSCGNFGEVYAIYKTVGHQDHPFCAYTVDELIDGAEEGYTHLVSTFDDVMHLLYMHTMADIDTVFGLQYTRIQGQWETNKEISHTKSAWERRELWALYYPRMMLKQLHITETTQLMSYNNVYALSYSDYLHNFDKIVYEFFDTINLSIIEERIQPWKHIYKLWQQIINLPFYKDLTHIIKCIVANIDYDLSKYNISMAEEIIITSKLLFDYNLSLMADGISTMPSNTTEWHSLLEENIYHNLSEYRIVSTQSIWSNKMTEYTNMAEEVTTITKDDVKHWLSASTAIVTFEKADGSMREMTATLQPEYLPETKEQNTNLARKDNSEVVTVWDIENAGWRSFRIDRIKSLLVE